jgi:hypothetical protein
MSRHQIRLTILSAMSRCYVRRQRSNVETGRPRVARHAADAFGAALARGCTLSMPSVIAKSSAVALLILALSPFTAPFSTCDVATLLAERADRSRGPARGTKSPTAWLTDAPLSQVALVACTARRVRLLTLLRPSCVSAVPGPLIGTELRGVRTTGIALLPVFQTILRI